VRQGEKPSRERLCGFCYIYVLMEYSAGGKYDQLRGNLTLCRVMGEGGNKNKAGFGKT
jgi:hypothetical protein